MKKRLNRRNRGNKMTAIDQEHKRMEIPSGISRLIVPKIEEKKLNIITKEDGSKVIENSSGYIKVWKNEDIVITDKIKIVVPEYIVAVMNSIETWIKTSEFSILVNTVWSADRKRLEIAPEYYIPQQKVSTAKVDYEEDNPNYNTVIHKHPNNCMKFSSTDEEYINRNFKYSLLWVNGKFQTGIANVQNEEFGKNVKFKINLDISIDSPTIEIPEEMINKIVEEKYTLSPVVGYSSYNPPHQNQNNFGQFYGSNYKEVSEPKSIGGRFQDDDSFYDIFDDETSIADSRRSKIFCQSFDSDERLSNKKHTKNVTKIHSIPESETDINEMINEMIDV